VAGEAPASTALEKEFFRGSQSLTKYPQFNPGGSGGGVICSKKEVRGPSLRGKGKKGIS